MKQSLAKSIVSVGALFVFFCIGIFLFLPNIRSNAQTNLGSNPNFTLESPGAKIVFVAPPGVVPPEIFTLPGAETNFTQVCTLEEALNLILDVSGKNKIVFYLPTRDLCKEEVRKNLHQYIELDTLGKVNVRSDLLPSLKDASGVVTMRNLPFDKEPDILVDGSLATIEDVEQKQWDGASHTLTFRVKHFTVYEAVEVDTVTHSVEQQLPSGAQVSIGERNSTIGIIPSSLMLVIIGPLLSLIAIFRKKLVSKEEARKFLTRSKKICGFIGGVWIIILGHMFFYVYPSLQHLYEIFNYPVTPLLFVAPYVAIFTVFLIISVAVYVMFSKKISDEFVKKLNNYGGEEMIHIQDLMSGTLKRTIIVMVFAPAILIVFFVLLPGALIISKIENNFDEHNSEITTRVSPKIRKLPVIQLRFAGVTYKGEEGSYCWPIVGLPTEETGAFCADSAFPDPQHTIQVHSGDTVAVEVRSDASPQYLNALFYTSSNDSNPQEREIKLATNNTVSLPINLDPGTYILQIFGDWAEGNISYGFKVVVKNRDKEAKMNDVMEKTRKLLISLGELPKTSVISDVKKYVLPPLRNKPYMYYCNDRFILQYAGGEHHKLEFYSSQTFRKIKECENTWAIGGGPSQSCSVENVCVPVKDFIYPLTLKTDKSQYKYGEEITITLASNKNRNETVVLEDVFFGSYCAGISFERIHNKSNDWIIDAIERPGSAPSDCDAITVSPSTPYILKIRIDDTHTVAPGKWRVMHTSNFATLNTVLWLEPLNPEHMSCHVSGGTYVGCPANGGTGLCVPCACPEATSWSWNEKQCLKTAFVPYGYDVHGIEVKYRADTDISHPLALLPKNLQIDVEKIQQLAPVGGTQFRWLRIDLKVTADEDIFITRLRSLQWVETAEFAPLPAPLP